MTAWVLVEADSAAYPGSDAINPESFFNLTDPERPTNPDTGKETPITVTATKMGERAKVPVPAVEIQLWQTAIRLATL